MATGEDGRGGLQDTPYSYHAGGGDKIFISWRGQQGRVLKGPKARSFLDRMSDLDVAEQQIAMAKETGKFKRGNERNG